MPRSGTKRSGVSRMKPPSLAPEGARLPKAGADAPYPTLTLPGGEGCMPPAPTECAGRAATG